jgi:hypothetical protein
MVQELFWLLRGKPDRFITSVAAVINANRIVKPSFESANKNSKRQKRNKDARS